MADVITLAMISLLIIVFLGTTALAHERDQRRLCRSLYTLAETRADSLVIAREGCAGKLGKEAP